LWNLILHEEYHRRPRVRVRVRVRVRLHEEYHRRPRLDTWHLVQGERVDWAFLS